MTNTLSYRMRKWNKYKVEGHLVALWTREVEKLETDIKVLKQAIETKEAMEDKNDVGFYYQGTGYYAPPQLWIGAILMVLSKKDLANVIEQIEGSYVAGGEVRKTYE